MDIGVEAGNVIAERSHARGDAAHEGGGGVLLRFDGLQLVQHNAGFAVALGEDADDVLPVRRGAGEHVEIDAAAEDAPVLMVGVVAADLRAPGGGKEGGLVGMRRKARGKGRGDALGAGVIRRAVERAQAFVQRAGGNGVQELHALSPSFFFKCSCAAG